MRIANAVDAARLNLLPNGLLGRQTTRRFAQPQARASGPSLSISRARKRLLEASNFHVSYERAVPFCIFLKSMKKLILDAQSTFSPNFIGVPLAQSKFSLMNTG